jgi:hypothetical protein
MRRLPLPLLTLSLLFVGPHSASARNPHATLADLKKLEILCYVPSWLPKGFCLKSVTITYDEPGPDEGSVGRFPLYYLEYSNNHGASFTIDSAREGIGDRNVMISAVAASLCRGVWVSLGSARASRPGDGALATANSWCYKARHERDPRTIQWRVTE